MSPQQKKIGLIAVLVFALAGLLFFRSSRVTPPADTPTVAVNVTATSTWTPARIPETIPIADDPLKDSILAAGDYLVRQQLTNGELSYQVDM